MASVEAFLITALSYKLSMHKLNMGMDFVQRTRKPIIEHFIKHTAVQLIKRK